MANEEWTPESVFKMVETTEAVTEAVQGVAGQAEKELADIQSRWRTAISDAEVAVERLQAMRYWALFHSAFVNDLHRLAGAESELTRIFEEKSRNLGYMIFGTTMKVAKASGVLVPRGTTEAAGVGSTLASFLDEEGIAAEVEQQAEEKSHLDETLTTNVVKLMAKAGTRRNGLKAGWTADEIDYGLRVVMPGVQIGAIETVLASLKKAGVVDDFNSGKPGIRIYAVKDDYAERLGWQPEEVKKPDAEAERLEALRRDLRSTLQSNHDASGKLLPWKLSSLFYALQDGHPWVTRPVVAATASAEPGCSEVAPQVYEWTERRAEPAKDRHPKAPGWYEKATPEERAALMDEPAILAGTPPEETIPTLTLRETQVVRDVARADSLVEMADAIYTLLKNEASSGQRRIWRDFDLHGLLWRGAELGVKVKEEHMNNPMIEDALAFLVAEDKLEVVPPSPERPWIRQPGWRVK